MDGKKRLLCRNLLANPSMQCSLATVVCRLSVVRSRSLSSNIHTDCPSPDSEITSQSLRVIPSTANALSRGLLRYLEDSQTKHCGFWARKLRDESRKTPTIKPVAVLLDVPHDEKRRWVATITTVTTTPRPRLAASSLSTNRWKAIKQKKTHKRQK